MTIKCEVYRKVNGRYTLVNTIEKMANYFIADILNDYERQKEDTKIKLHYNYKDTMNIDVYYSNGYKYSYYNVPCSSGARIDTLKILGRV